MLASKPYTPLRYPGGKAKFAPFIADIMNSNGLASGHYLEPYAGGAAVALELLFKGVASHVHINDYDPAIFDFWHSITHHPETILKLLHDTPVNIDQWYYWRSVLRGDVCVPQVKRGFATLFMNRTNRSGILKGGVIGGKNQDGAYRLDARFNKQDLAKRIECIALQKKNISIYNIDALTLLKKAKTFLPKKSLIYLDPPYYVKGQGLYRNYYEHADHVAIAKQLQHKYFKINWVVSYDNVEQIQQMYQLSKSLQYGLNYTAQKRYVGSEIMFFSPYLNIRKINTPSIKSVA